MERVKHPSASHLMSFCIVTFYVIVNDHKIVVNANVNM
jgi:hypothetical protein